MPTSAVCSLRDIVRRPSTSSGRSARHREGLVLLSDDLTALTAWKQDEAEDLYVELTPGPEMQEAVAMSRRLNLPPVATTRASFLRPADYHAHRLLTSDCREYDALPAPCRAMPRSIALADA